MNRISVIMPVFNTGNKLWRAIESLRQQTLQDFDVYIADSGSTDRETISILDELKQEKRTTILRGPCSNGPSLPRNMAIESAGGDFIVPFDSDDVLPSNALEIVQKYFLANPDADFLFGNYVILDGKTNQETIFNSGKLANRDGYLEFKKILEHGFILLGCCPFRKSAWKAAGKYKERCGYLEDLDFWLSVLEGGGKGLFVDHKLYEWHKSGGGRNAKVAGYDYFLLHYYHQELYKQNGRNLRFPFFLRIIFWLRSRVLKPIFRPMLEKLKNRFYHL